MGRRRSTHRELRGCRRWRLACGDAATLGHLAMRGQAVVFGLAVIASLGFMTGVTLVLLRLLRIDG